jgi:DNA-3-methyladenine glycosylase
MSASYRLPRSFFAQPTLQVARQLLGTRLLRLEGGATLAGYITETEAYIGEEDLACHARAGLTERTRVMYGPPGHAYVYFTYGKHWMLNFVTQEAGFPAAVLIRAVFPVQGIPRMASRRRGQPRPIWTDGPAKLCQAFGIDGALHGLDLCQAGAPLVVQPGLPVPDECVTTGPRVGLNSVPEPWKSLPWRFRVQGMRSLLRVACNQKSA